jgi:hypothetical protein
MPQDDAYRAERPHTDRDTRLTCANRHSLCSSAILRYRRQGISTARVSHTAKVAPRWVSRNSCRRPLEAAPLPTDPSQAKKSLGLPVLGSAAPRDASSLHSVDQRPT